MGGGGIADGPPGGGEFFRRGLDGHPAVRQAAHPLHGALHDVRLGGENVGVVGDPDGRRGLLHWLGPHGDAFKGVEFSRKTGRVVPPEHAQHRDIFLQPLRPLGWGNPEGLVFRVELACDCCAAAATPRAPAADANHQQAAALGNIVQRSPLGRQHDGIAQGEAGHAGGAQPHLAGARRQCRQRGYRLQPWLGQQVVAHEHGVEQPGGLGGFGQLQKFSDGGGAEHHPLVGQQQSQFHGGCSHFVPCVIGNGEG